ncbi:MAG: hypothetical protein HOQ03_01960 [Thermoleophilia bacterium]|nr:hypothetical protein [Thermoleophilia bacterium]
MAVRGLRGAGLRRAARSRAGVAALAAALYLGAGLLATAPAVFETDRFLGYGTPREGRVTPGDHLQTAYALWLPGHQLARGAEPWLDPYSFQPELEPRVNAAGWPFAAVYGPLRWLLGTVAGWNAFVLLTYVGAGGFAALWLRSLGLGLGPALVGGLAFALAPYRVAQSTGHLLGPISIFIPLALYAVERRLAWLAAAALATIPLSGQVHLALGAIPFVLAYALARRRPVLGGVAAATAVAAGLLVWALTLRESVERPYAEVERYSASVGDFLARDLGEFERFVYLGWLLPLAALAGVACLCFGNTISSGRRLALVLGLGALVPSLLALGSNLPGYGFVWRHTPLHATRVPERMLPIACLCLAALAAAALACVSETQGTSRARRLVAVAAVALVAADLWVPLYDPLVADEDNAVYAQVRAAPAGRLLEVPVLPPDAYAGSVYLYYAMQAPRERPLGYATSAPPEAFRAARRLAGRAAELGIRVVVEYRDGVPRRLRTGKR